MSHGSDKRNRALARRCAKLAADGRTHRQIAETVGKRPEQIKALVLLGERVAEHDADREMLGGDADHFNGEIGNK